MDTSKILYFQDLRAYIIVRAVYPCHVTNSIVGTPNGMSRDMLLMASYVYMNISKDPNVIKLYAIKNRYAMGLNSPLIDMLLEQFEDARIVNEDVIKTAGYECVNFLVIDKPEDVVMFHLMYSEHVV